MSFKTSHWQPEQPLPKYADRATAAKIVSHLYFPIADRTLQTWPLTVRRPNRSAIYHVQEVLDLAEKKLQGAVAYKQGNGNG